MDESVKAWSELEEEDYMDVVDEIGECREVDEIDEVDDVVEDDGESQCRLNGFMGC
jgi:hypothetical protein